MDTTGADAVVARARLFDTASQAVIGTMADGTIIFWSATSEQMYGWSADEVLGRDILDVTPSRMTRDAASELMEHLRSGRSWSGTFGVQRRGGHEFTVAVRNLPVLDERGGLVGIVGISMPVPETEL